MPEIEPEDPLEDLLPPWDRKQLEDDRLQTLDELADAMTELTRACRSARKAIENLRDELS